MKEKVALFLEFCKIKQKNLFYLDKTEVLLCGFYNKLYKTFKIVYSYKQMGVTRMTRASGILMHISSLPSRYGIGTFGREAYRFVDFLEKAGQKYWQVLPMGPTDYGNSPYQSSSVFAGNPFFIDLDFLVKDGLLEAEDCDLDWGSDPERVDYDALLQQRMTVLRKAFEGFIPGERFHIFCRKNSDWLEDYALYMAIKKEQGSPWQKWPQELKQRKRSALEKVKRSCEEEILFQKFLQYKFYEQWNYLKRYAMKKGVAIIGDVPIYTAPDSADTWANGEQFQLNKEGYPSAVAGVPPDAFSETGQLWGNPLYRWDKMQWDGYQWWARRMEHNLKLYDKVRIDHFRGLESYWSIPAGDKTAENGHWEKGPGMKLFRALERKLGTLNVIAEDLGILTDEVHRLREATGFPGMKILQFAFDPDSESTYLPHNCSGNCVVYSGTHDNDTALGWFDHLDEKEQEFVCRYLNIKGREEISWALIRSAWSTSAPLAVVQMQDVLDLPHSARMNLPGTVGSNWSWRMKPEQLSDELAAKLNKLTKTYYR